MEKTPAFIDHVVSGSCSLSIRDYGGEGPAILLMHGAHRNLSDLAPIATRLAAWHRVVAMDLRSHGRSEEAPWLWADVLGDVDRVIEASGLDNPALVGHSLGGMIASLYNARGGRCSVVVNIDGYGLGTAGQYLGVPKDAVHDFQREVERLIRIGQADASQRIASSGLDDVRAAACAAVEALDIPAELESATFDRSVRSLPDRGFAIRPSSRAVDQLRTALREIDWIKTFRKVSAPFLIYNCIAEEASPLLCGIPQGKALMAAYRRGLRRDLDTLSQLSPNVRVLTVHARHMLILTMPDTLAGEIHQFVAAAT
jgi:pimeloyl-ACP methyl ester carboxylesterase